MKNFRVTIAVLGIGAIAMCGATERKTAQSTIDFNRDIRPLLSDRCFKCHGPDQNARKAKLRLDRAEDAYAERKHGHAIVAGKPEQSLVYQRIYSSDQEEVMPPPDSHLALNRAEKEKIRQ